METQYTFATHHYEYNPLPNGLFTRYMLLYPAATGTDPLVCTIFTKHLNELPEFEAISYVWGTPLLDQMISCDKKSIYITANLRDALRQVRFTDKPRKLWVDSICIDQTNSEEKGHQVSLMGEIYKKANRTLICVGISDHLHASDLVELITSVDYMIKAIFKSWDCEWPANSFPFTDEDNPLLSHRGWKSLHVLLQYPWFKRCWVVQEAALNQNTVLLWADKSIKWLKLLRTYTWYVRRALRLPQMEQLWLSNLHLQGYFVHRQAEAIAFYGVDAKPHTFLEILDHARWLDVSDQRDRIYALLGLPNTDQLLPVLRASYDATYFRIYHSFAYDYINICKDLVILHFVQNDAIVMEAGLVSWVPRWNIRRYSSYTGILDNYQRSTRCITSQQSPLQDPIFLNRNTIKLRAVIIDTVRMTMKGFDKNATTPHDVKLLWEFISTIQHPCCYSCSPLLAFVEVFRCGMFRGRLREWNTFETAYMQFLEGKLLDGGAAYSDVKHFHERRMEDVHNKRFIVTNRGFYGLAPDIVREGDNCCILFGTKSPFILRKVDRVGYYKLVGSTLLLSEKLNRHGRPGALGMHDECQEWREWGLEEQDIFLC